MKMVIVFDTDDRQGMTNTVHIVDKLAAEYLNKNVDERYKRTFSKIEFIKMLRSFAINVKNEIEKGDEGADPIGLRFSKIFSEEVWDRKEGGERY